MAITEICGVALALAGLVWHDASASDFYDIDPTQAPNEDPNTLMSASLSFPSTGVVRVSAGEQLTARNGIQEGACFPMVPLLEDTGDGKTGYVWEMEWSAETGAPAGLGVSFGMVDEDGSPVAGGNMSSFGGGRTGASWWVQHCNATGTFLTAQVSIADHKLRIVWYPNGDVGDDTQVGVSKGTWGIASVFGIKKSDESFTANAYRGTQLVASATSGAMLPVMVVTWDSAGADVATMDIKMRWAALPMGYTP